MDSANSATPPLKPVGLWKDPILWFVVGLFLIYGGVYNILPVTFPIFKDVFNCTLEQMGRTQLLFFISGLVFSATGGWIIARLGIRYGTVVALVFLAGTLTVIGMAPSFPVVLLGAFCFGLALSALNVICNALISNHFSDKRQSVFFVMGLCDSGGAVAGPALIGRWFAYAQRTGASWRAGYFGAAGAAAAFLPWALLLRSIGQAGQGKEGKPKTAALSMMREVLTAPAIYAACLLGFFHGLAQGGMMSFVGQLYQSKFSIDAGQAAYFISVDAAGLFAGRFLLGWITARRKILELAILGICGSGETLAFVATIISPSYLWGLLLFFCAGAFVSGNGPSLNSYVGASFQGEKSGTAFALFIGISSIGAALGPYIIGVIGNRFGVETGIWFMPVLALAIPAFAFGWLWRERSRAGRQSLQAGLVRSRDSL